MSYKKRVAIFFSVISGVFMLLSVFYVMQTRSLIKDFDKESMHLDEFRKIKESFNSSLENKFEFTE